MDVRDLDRIAFVTRHFRDLQGLRNQVPFGMLLLSQGLTPWMFLGPVASRHLYLPLLSLLVFGLLVGYPALTFWARRYYRNLFGEVDVRRGGTPLSSYWMVFFLAGLALLVLLAAGSLSSWRAAGVLFGSIHLGVWCRREHRWSQGYYLLLGGLLLMLALLFPVGPFAAEQRIFSGVPIPGWIVIGLFSPVQQAVFSSACGVSFLLAGLLDHWQLVHTLGQLPPPELDEAAAVAETTR